MGGRTERDREKAEAGEERTNKRSKERKVRQKVGCGARGELQGAGGVNEGAHNNIMTNNTIFSRNRNGSFIF